jgi:predicted DNA-binding transcriptional regulator AlpA
MTRSPGAGQTPTGAETGLGQIVDGRRVYTRAELAAVHGLGRSTLERWYRDRAETGHPEAVATLGRALVWDAQAWQAWYDRIRETDDLVSLDDIAAQHGFSRATAARLWDQRAHNGHPAWAKRVGRVLYWRAGEYDTWYETYRAAQAPSVDRGGDPQERITLAEAARMLGMLPSSITQYPTRPPVGWPEPVEVEQLPSGRLRRWYTRAQIQRYVDERRVGGGRPPGAQVQRRFPYDGDARLDVARQALQASSPGQQSGLAARLAAEHGGTPGTWANIVTVARRHP